MARKSPFKILISRLIIVGVIVLVSFPLGVLAYLYTISIGRQEAVKNLIELVAQAASHDTTIHIGDQTFIIKKGELNSWVESYTREYTGQPDVRFTNTLDAYILSLAQKTDRPAIDAKFIFNNGAAVILAPAQTGEALNISVATAKLRHDILADESEIILTPEITQPAITADKINSLGVNDQIAVGTSNFSGSTLARIQNIKVGATKFNGWIIKPNETFSFDTILGDVVASTGYAPEKVIDGGKIQYEYGGGLCQVSTTLFRAAIAAGFPIVERKPHAFPVHYYEPQGFDATIYPGSADLKFINNTKGPVLLESHISGKILTFEIYGTSDGRVVTVDGPHQYDQQADGSLKAYFVRTIKFADGASMSQRFDSVYKSPSLFPTEANPYD